MLTYWEHPFFYAFGFTNFTKTSMHLESENLTEALLLLADGRLFRGKAIGAIGTCSGELCFNTAMTGYQELYTDPSYFGQILINTSAHIGNYGAYAMDNESDRPKIAGLVVKNYAELFSRHIAKESLDAYFKRHNVVGIAEVDTRELVRHIRSKGAMNAIISSQITDVKELEKKLNEVPGMEGLELASKVSTKTPYFVGDENASLRVAVVDLGVKRSILKHLSARDCYLKVFPAQTVFSEIMAWQPDGIFMSNGPGDPAATDYAVKTTRKVLSEELPFFGICLGHQILARAVEVSTFKMHHGHRGGNHPVINMESGKAEITTQNHGFAVSEEALLRRNEEIRLTHRNLNDGSVEGIRLIGKPAFSVQYHPEASPGPHDSHYLFDDFIQLIRKHKTK